MSALPAALSRELASLLGTEGWRTDPNERLTYGYDNSRRQAMPDAVALPVEPAQVERAHAAMGRVFALALSLGGTLSGEHGIGLAKRGFMAQAMDPPTLQLMRQLKAVFDPDGILNPGKLLP